MSDDHARRMDRMYHLQRWIYDPTRRWYLLGRDRLIDDLAVPAPGSVLEIACGTGRNLIRIGDRCPDARLYGVDLSAEMLKSARRGCRRAGLGHRCSLARGDAAAFDPAGLFDRHTRFDRIVISYALSMIPAWRTAIDHALDLLTPGGGLHVVDFGHMEGWPGPARAAMRQWLRGFHVAPRPGLPGYLTDHGTRLGATVTRETIGAGYAELMRLTLPDSLPGRRYAHHADTGARLEWR